MGTVRAVRGDAMNAGPATQGMSRKIAAVGDGVVAAETRMEPQTMSGWHHHGEHTSCVYVVDGRMLIEWGPVGRESLELAPGDFYVVSPNTVHREGNPGSYEQTIVAFGVGSGTEVINVDGPESEAPAAGR